MRWLLLVPVLALGCAGSFEETRGAVTVRAVDVSQRCAELDDEHRRWGAVAKGSGVVAGGLGALPVAVEMTDGARLGVAGGALAAGALAASAVIISESAAESWARECSR